MNKSKTPQPMTPSSPQGRDLFQTPNYAVDLLTPFIPKKIRYVWEPTAGGGKIVDRLRKFGYYVWATDIRIDSEIHETYNFIDGNEENTIPYQVWKWIDQGSGIAIITNPPFSLKQKFYEKCREYNKPFALLIPADYSGWIIQATIEGAEKIIPTRRIDYITPNILTRIHEGEVYDLVKKNPASTTLGFSLEQYKISFPGAWQTNLNSHFDIHNYTTIDEVPQELLHKYSSSDFHSMWLTWGFEIGRTETFVDLTIKQKRENI